MFLFLFFEVNRFWFMIFDFGLYRKIEVRSFGVILFYSVYWEGSFRIVSSFFD